MEIYPNHEGRGFTGDEDDTRASVARTYLLSSDECDLSTYRLLRLLRAARVACTVIQADEPPLIPITEQLVEHRVHGLPNLRFQRLPGQALAMVTGQLPVLLEGAVHAPHAQVPDEFAPG